MKRKKNIILLGGIAVLALALMFGCIQPSWNSIDPDTGYIRLDVGQPGAKGISVDYREVAGLSITVYDPEEQELATFEWDADDGPQSYLVQVTESGTYRIKVTHNSDDDGGVVNVTEWAEFDIESMVITVIDVIPGVIGAIQVEGQDGGGEFEDGTLTVHITDPVDPSEIPIPDGILVAMGVYAHGVDPMAAPLLAVGANELMGGAAVSTMTPMDSQDEWIGMGGARYDVYIWFDMDGDLDIVQYPELGTDWVLGEFPVTVQINGNTDVYIEDPVLQDPPDF